MLRIAIVVLLACASAQVLAQNGRNGAEDSCVEADTGLSLETDPASAPVASKAGAIRSKYAKPTAVPSGGGNDDALPRARSNKWHSFLPGMFR